MIIRCIKPLQAKLFVVLQSVSGYIYDKNLLAENILADIG